MKSDNSCNNVFEFLAMNPAPNSRACAAKAVCDDCSSTGINGLSALTSRHRSMPASSFSVEGESPLCSTNPTSEMMPSRFFLYRS